MFLQQEYDEDGLRDLCATDANEARLEGARVNIEDLQLCPSEHGDFSDSASSQTSDSDSDCDSDDGVRDSDDGGTEDAEGALGQQQEEEWSEEEDDEQQTPRQQHFDPDIFNKPLYEMVLPTDPDAAGQQFNNVSHCAVNVGSAVTNLMSWKQDHEVSDKAFNNLLHIVKRLLPPANRLPLTLETCSQRICVAAPAEFQRDRCRPGKDEQGCWNYG